MTYQTTLNNAWNNLAQLGKRVLEEQDIVMITQPDGKKVDLIAVAELSGRE